MGRAFEYRKATKLKRWGHMAKTFTRLGKQIAIAVKAKEPVVPKFPPNLLNTERTSATVRVVLSVNVSTNTATP